MSDATAPPPPEAGVVVFVYTDWIARFPEFAAVPAPLAQLYFNDATLILDNTPQSVATAPDPRTQLLYLLTAHIAKLSGWGPGVTGAGMGSGTVGAVTNATEGSVSVGVQALAGASASALRAWLSQTQYGAMYYAMTGAYRMARWYPGQQPYLGVGPRYFGNGRMWWAR